ncbi:TetR family transcriptional regulator [Burkholderia sp. Ac-20379]|nr:TetR family transcriptional regulator [Burkholderia sp. Ac-20379]
MLLWNIVPVIVKSNMKKKDSAGARREASLSRERIVAASIELLDAHGERGLTFRVLAERLATGPGAIYWHVENKSELLTAACDAVVARTIEATAGAASPAEVIRQLALALFDTFIEHPWVGSALTDAPGQLPTVRIFERIGQQIRALGVAPGSQWMVASALFSYIVGISGQNAANAEMAHEQGLDRVALLSEVSAAWLQLDPDAYPFVRSMAPGLSAHDDRADFLAGVDLILGGLAGAAPATPAAKTNARR